MLKPRSSRGVWTPSATKIFQLRIALRYIEPPIWRRVLVPDNWLLGELHPLFATVMGWAGYHMHQFSFGGGFKQERYSTHEMTMECGGEMHDEGTVLLSQVLLRKGQAFTYEYDFGDSWLHQVKVEKILPYDSEMKLPVCIDGARACPPEDCGSFPGYANVLRVLANAQTQEDREFRKWVGHYDPERFDLEAVNRRIQPTKRATSR